MTTEEHSSVPATSGSIFRHVAVGIDGTEAAVEACRQALRLAEPGTPIDAVAVVHLAEVVQAGINAAHMADVLARDAEKALDEAADILGTRARKTFVNGYVVDALIREIEQTKATAIALGTHGHWRATEILIGGVAGELLHDAPCSVLIARRPPSPSGFPRSIVAGIDGSAEAEAALAAARQLATRFDAALRVVTALDAKDVDLARVRRAAPFVDVVDQHPVDALVAASHDSDIVVVGSRGLHGLQALGSVSERVAHEAACSVLVVRPTPSA
jgi:nucleotide-binding universal stress UspA family protein